MDGLQGGDVRGPKRQRVGTWIAGGQMWRGEQTRSKCGTERLLTICQAALAPILSGKRDAKG